MLSVQFVAVLAVLLLRIAVVVVSVLSHKVVCFPSAMKKVFLHLHEVK